MIIFKKIINIIFNEQTFIGFLFILVLVLFVFVVLTPSSDLKNYKTYKLSSGEIVKCKNISYRHCGVDICDCENGKSFVCLTNVEEIKQ